MRPWKRTVDGRIVAILVLVCAMSACRGATTSDADRGGDSAGEVDTGVGSDGGADDGDAGADVQVHDATPSDVSFDAALDREVSADATSRDSGYGDSGAMQGVGGLCYPKPDGSTCPPSEFCSFEWTPGTCGFAPPNPTPGPGTCMQRPAACAANCPGVCGCDGVSYCNACLANAAGVDIRSGAKCADEGSP